MDDVAVEQDLRFFDTFKLRFSANSDAKKAVFPTESAMKTGRKRERKILLKKEKTPVQSGVTFNRMRNNVIRKYM